MSKKFKSLIVFFGLLFLISTVATYAQILRDTSSLNLIKKGVDYIYNMQFKNAEDVCNKFSQSYPGHPVVFLLKGMITYWENYPLIPTSPARKSYEKDLRSSIEKSEKFAPEDEAEFLLANLCARGMLLLFYSDNNLFWKI